MEENKNVRIVCCKCGVNSVSKEGDVCMTCESKERMRTEGHFSVCIAAKLPEAYQSMES